MIDPELIKDAMAGVDEDSLETQQQDMHEIEEKVEKHFMSEQALDEAIHTSQEQLAQLEALIEYYENNDGDISVEHLASDYPELTHGLEAISLKPGDLMSRYVQLTITGLREYGNAWTDATKQRAEVIDSLHTKYDLLKTKWDGKRRGKDTKDDVNITYVGVHQIFSTNNKVLTKLPLKAIDDDVKVMDYVINRYGSVMSADLKTVQRTLNGANVSSDADFEKSVLKNLLAMGAPVKRFEQKYVRTKPVMLGNKSLWVKHSVGDKLLEIVRGKLNNIEMMSKKIVPRLRDHRLVNRGGGILHDMSCSRSDIDKFFRASDELNDLAKDGIVVMNENINMVNKLIKVLESLEREVKDADLNKINIAQFRSVTKYLRVLADCSTQPMRDVTNHCIEINRGLFTLTSTAVSRM